MRKLLVGGVVVLACAAGAQTPDVVIKADAGFHYRSQRLGGTTLRWYDALGKHSTVSLSFLLEPGFRAFVSQRLQRIPNDGDPEQLDAYYIEDPGIWRVGKQDVPFGRGLLMRESARAARSDTNLLFDRITVTGAVFDNGGGRNQGVSLRIGGPFGASVALGRHFGIQGTSLTSVRRPEDAPGAGRGYRLAFGVDAKRNIGRYVLEAEALALRQGHTAADVDQEVSEVMLHLTRDRKRDVRVAWSRSWRDNRDFFRGTASVALSDQLWVEPLIRFNRSGLYDVGVSVRFKL